ncbi:TonB-dependent receptor [Larkinella soli]|uniref:TonB-dependent receptor n=1 Tax=Larkinella soli TaxID=1770527 RepID=UPI000FFBF15B|nr:TonB-dependent receptor [Larkinella soli]
MLKFLSDNVKQPSTYIGAILIFCAFNGLAQPVTSLSGFVRENDSRRPLHGVNIYLPDYRIGTTTDASGYYTLTAPVSDTLKVAYSFVGFQTIYRTLSFHRSASQDVFLTPGQDLNEVAVRLNRSGETQTPQLSRLSVPITQIRQLPALLGEKDVLKVLQLLPGVQKAAEGTTGIYVRGGGPDQNLITLDEAVVYNPNHLLGFFSVFNGDALRNVSLTKGGFPARYGGRLSSVIEMDMKEGDNQKLHGTGSAGLIASRFTLEGPLQKGRASFLVSARQCYLGLLTRMFASDGSGSLPTQSAFSDYNAKLAFDLGPRDRLTVSGFMGTDAFQGRREYNDHNLRAGLDWSNATGSLRWSHRFSDRLSSATSLLFSRYQLTVSNQETAPGSDQVYRLAYVSGIRDFSIKHDLDFQAGTSHQLKFGLLATTHRFTPSAVVSSENRKYQPDSYERTDVLETGIYAEDLWQPTRHLRINGGIRLSYFQYETTRYARPEPRLSVAWELPAAWSVKAAYARMNQYVHMLSNTGVGLPTDLWVPTTDRVRPQQSEQFSFGLAKDFSPGMALTVEAYHKTMTNNLSYREGASFLLPQNSPTGEKPRWEDNVTAGKGWSYGAEVLLQKKKGQLSGWIGYTLSWTQWQFAELNGGRPFFPRYDRRHDFSLVGIYELSSKVRLSGTWVYGTGQALTLPLARYALNPNQPQTGGLGNNQIVKDYGEKNSFRGEAFHRMDLSLQYHTRKRSHERTWELSVYNAYNRRNPFYYSLESKVEQADKPSRTVLYRYSLFPVVPTLSYSFSF